MESGDIETFVAYGRGRYCQGAWVDGNDDRADGDTKPRLTFTAEGDFSPVQTRQSCLDVSGR